MTSNPNNPETTSSDIQKAIEEKRFDEALNAFTDLHPADQAEVFNDLDDDQQDLILRNLDVPTTADLSSTAILPSSDTIRGLLSG